MYLFFFLGIKIKTNKTIATIQTYTPCTTQYYTTSKVPSKA